MTEEDTNIMSTSSTSAEQLQHAISDGPLDVQNRDETAAATASLDMSKVIMPSTSQTLADTKKTKRKEKQLWTDKEDEALMIAVLEERKTRDEKEEDEDDLDEDDFEEEEEEDWEVMDWDLIAASVPGRSSVECLKRYLKHKKRHAKAAHTSIMPGNIDTATTSIDEKPSALSAGTAGKPPKRKGTSIVTESEEMTLSPKSKKKKDETKWTDDELGLLSSLAEQYQDGKYTVKM